MPTPVPNTLLAASPHPTAPMVNMCTDNTTCTVCGSCCQSYLAHHQSACDSCVEAECSTPVVSPHPTSAISTMTDDNSAAVDDSSMAADDNNLGSTVLDATDESGVHHTRSGAFGLISAAMCAVVALCMAL